MLSQEKRLELVLGYLNDPSDEMWEELMCLLYTLYAERSGYYPVAYITEKQVGEWFGGALPNLTHNDMVDIAEEVRFALEAEPVVEIKTAAIAATHKLLENE